MPVSLVFGRARYAGGPVDLVFGAGAGEVVRDPVAVHATIELEDVQITANAQYDNRVVRCVGRPVQTSHQRAADLEVAASSHWGSTGRLRLGTHAAWGAATPLDGTARSQYASTVRVAGASRVVWERALRLDRTTKVAYESAAKRRVSASSAWQLASFAEASAAELWQSIRRLRATGHDGWQLAVSIARSWQDGYRAAEQLYPLTVSRWERARAAPQGRTVRPVAPLVPPRVPSTHLVFACPPAWLGSGPVHLVFGRVCRPQVPALVIVSKRAFYMTINSVDLRRASDNQSLPAHTFGMALDADSWTWSWSATLDRSAEALVQPVAGQPTEVLATVNGVPYRLQIGRIARSKEFPRTRLRVSGLGIAAILEAPNAPVQTYSSAVDMTAQQLMEQVLTVNGQSIGWVVDWGLTDWLVPGGAWTFQGTPMQALQDIASSVGGYLQPHPTAQTVRVLPRYPYAPWTWDTVAPDLQLPGDVVDVESMEWVDRPSYNRVFVGGVGAGVFGPVTRSGSAGDVLAPQVTHPLITHADAHRQRGLSVLADTGRQVHMSLRLPVLPETGLIVPGKMVRYVADQPRLGIVRSVSLDWSSPVMRQTIGVESHAA